MASPSFIDAVMDGGPNYIKTNCTRVDVCTSEPANYAGIAAVTVGNYTVSSSDFTLANGDVSGRKVTLGQKTGNNGTGTGAANFVVFSNGSSTLYGVINGDGDTINSGSPFTINAVDVWEVQDPT